MLHLRPMRADEFDAYSALFIEENAIEMAEIYEIGLESARANSMSIIERHFPDGVGSPDQYIYCVEQKSSSGSDHIGYIWFSINREEGYAWLCDIMLFEPYRGQGLGTQGLTLAEEILSSMGIRSMSLHVASNNPRAYKLYLKHGYKVTGYNMKREW
jgi:ribosomal protein S18 acetylase RimI-like enzyme